MSSGKSERIIDSLGCGLFQVIFYINVALVTYTATIFSNHFMAFGNYNPGWRCLDSHNDTLDGDNFTSITNLSFNKTGLELNDHALSVKNETISNGTVSGEYRKGDCPAFESCKNVEFNPETSTIVTEWGLVCGKAWIPSFIISLQMTGLVIGAGLVGIASDAFGRKWVYYTSSLFILIINIIFVFTRSWQMFAVLRLLIGIPVSFQLSLIFIYLSELVPRKWRAIVIGSPCYPIGVVAFGLICYLLKDWRKVHIATSVTAVMAILPVIWVPESLRWLEVKNKMKRFESTAQKIAKYNGKKIPALDHLTTETKLEIPEQSIKKTIHNILHLFRRDYRKYTLLISVPWLLISLLYYAMAFGVKALSGNFYANLIIVYGMEVVVDSGLMFVPNIIGRKKAGVSLSLGSGVCLILAAFFQDLLSGNAKIYGVTVLVGFGRISISAFWLVMELITVELYPTVIRGTANSWGLMLTRFGAALAPILIPNDNSSFFVSYVVMSVLAFICAIIVMILPETKDKPLQDTLNSNLTHNITVNEKDDSINFLQ